EWRGARWFLRARAQPVIPSSSHIVWGGRASGARCMGKAVLLSAPGGRALDYQQVRCGVLSGREMKTTEPGVLTVAAVPIGQPADAAPRLTQALATAGVIAAENTHRLRRLAASLGVTLAGRIEHYQDVGEKDKADGLVTVLAGGQDVLLVT